MERLAKRCRRDVTTKNQVVAAWWRLPTTVSDLCSAFANGQIETLRELDLSKI
jgi:hypothetical protein